VEWEAGTTVAFTIKCETQGLKALIKRMQALDGTEVEAGFFEEDRYGPEQGNLPVAFVAYMNEYGHSLGLQGTPERPFMHETFEGTREQFHFARAMRKVFLAALTDGRGIDRLLKGAGVIMVDVIQASIDDYPGSNSPATIARKGFDDPLRNTDKMLNSVKFKIHKGGRVDA
jgi:hypothetical protein